MCICLTMLCLYSLYFNIPFQVGWPWCQCSNKLSSLRADLYMALMSAGNSSTGLQNEEEWTTFLSATDIPPEDATRYSRLLVKASITGSIVDCLDKDTLHDLGIKVLGHKLAILKRISISRTPPDLDSTSTVSKPSSDAPATARISAKLPTLQDEMTHQQFRKFRVDWDVYKRLTRFAFVQRMRR